MRRVNWAAVALGAALGGACGGGGGAAPTPNPPPVDPTATFTLAGAFTRTYQFSGGAGNLVFCRPAPRFWIRLAEQRAADGENGPHIDIDICNYGGSGRFQGMDPSLPCTPAATFDIYWHASGAVFSNQASSTACQLDTSLSGTTLTGSFTCRGLVERGGTRLLDVVDGTFRCTVGA